MQAKALVDTLAVRKLPSLWLMVTIPEPLPRESPLRPDDAAGGADDVLEFRSCCPIRSQRLPDFPDDAVIRTDDPEHVLPAH